MSFWRQAGMDPIYTKAIIMSGLKCYELKNFLNYAEFLFDFFFYLCGELFQ